jgi:hypothetical protein
VDVIVIVIVIVDENGKKCRPTAHAAYQPRASP